MKKVLIILAVLGLIGCSKHVHPTEVVDTSGLEAMLIQLQNRIIELETQSGLTAGQIDMLQSDINVAQSQIASLATQESIVELIDPCGDNPGQYDEVLIRTSSNKLIAFFEQGGQRFLSVLEAGSYRTTDTQQCLFNVDSNGVVTY